ncbi:MAG: zinc-dependent alcohol dehydrogenase family protein, partial [Chloroflexota bacterium]|nr:zinc-dependent alcohol dehydrogenase family protein [Chloroflexota bacterium]
GACGICGTDVHITDGEFPPTPYPIVPGHEFAGTVIATGPGVRDLREGQRVAVDPSLFCGSCRFCRVGRGNLCERWAAIGDTVDGAFAERVRVPVANAYPLPDQMPFWEAALIEPLSCAVHGLDRLQARSGDTVLVYGAGTMGLLLAQLARHGGAGLVAICDVNRGRLERAREFGFSAVGTSLDEILAFAPGGFDRVIEATGVTRVVESAFAAVGKGGTLLIFGVSPGGETASLEPFRIYNQEISVIGSMAVLHSFGRALELLRAGAIDAGRMVSHSFSLDEFPRALELVRRGGGLKVQVTPAGGEGKISGKREEQEVAVPAAGA